LLAPAFAAAPEAAPPAAEKAAPKKPDAASETPVAPPKAAEAETAPGKTMTVIYLGKEYEEPLPLSYAEKPITDKGIQGARLMLKEANQAGNFVGHNFELVEAILPADGDVVAKAKELLKGGDAFILADLEPDDLIAVADLPEAKSSIIMNVRSSATALREELCRTNVFHVIPDYAMRADALAQYLIWKKWPRWFVIRRDTLEDQDYLAQVKRAAARFGGKVVGEKVYALPPGARNLDSGHQQIQAQMPMETEGAPEHDVVWVINSDDDFGDYLMYRTYLPRPVVGTQGLQATAWDKSYTESGAMHFQNAIPRLAKRAPVERDYTAWLAFRALSDSAMKSGKTTPQELKTYLLSDDFRLEGFKGQAMSFRGWDHQMRQPVILGGGTRVPVSTSPQEGFLHPTNITDTLGFDQPESKCKF
jgi:ABC transporter substrate binding protein (PQQ-dependent alcohol dehydrogenase system)